MSFVGMETTVVVGLTGESHHVFFVGMGTTVVVGLTGESHHVSFIGMGTTVVMGRAGESHHVCPSVSAQLAGAYMQMLAFHIYLKVLYDNGIGMGYNELRAL